MVVVGLPYRNSALHLQSFMHHAIDKFLDSRGLLWLVRVVHEHLVEVAVADVTHDTREHAQFCSVNLALVYISSGSLFLRGRGGSY